MCVYIIGFLISLILIWISQNKVKSKKSKIALMILAVVPIFIISAFRYDVGEDYIKRYTNDYLNLAQGKDVDNLEIGFKIIDYICLIFTKEPYILFIITSFIILSVVYETIFRKSSNKLISIMIFFLGGFFFASLNLVRQYMAIAFILIGYQFLLSHNKIKAYVGFLICGIIAFLMHSSSIICFIMIFLNRKVIVDIKWVLPLSAIIILLNENIMKILEPIIEKTRFDVYLSGKFAKGEFSALNIVENLIVYLWMYGVYLFNKKRNLKLEKEGILFLNIQGIAFLVTIAGTIHMQFLRIAIYFWIFQILSIPYFLSLMPLDYITLKINNRLKKDFKSKNIKIVAYAVIIIGFMLIFGYTNILNNDNKVIPYKTVFSIDRE